MSKTSAGWGDHKVEALLAHESQFETTMEIGTDDGADRAAFRARIHAELAEHGGLARLDQGEAFKRIDDL